MTRPKFITFMCLAFVMATLCGGINQASAQYVPPPQLVPGVNYMLPNYANSPVLTKFKDPLPGIQLAGAAVPGFYFNGATGGLNIPVAVADTATFAKSAYYEIALVDFTQIMHTDMPATKLRGYVQLETPAVLAAMAAAVPPMTSAHYPLPNGLFGVTKPTYLGPIIVATKDTATRIKFYNLLPAGAAGDLFLPVDVTYPGAGLGPDGVTIYSQNRATLHLHGGDNPWISDGTALQWIAAAGETNAYKKGASQQNVPDMLPLPVEGDGTATFYWPNGQSGRLMFYHDHAQGMTRLNPYAGEAAGYLLVDPTERALNSFAPGGEIPLVIQEKGFVNDGSVPAGFTGIAPAATTAVDPLWASNPNWGTTKGSLWWPHVYMPNQNPNDLSGANPLGRWDYGAWFWPIFPSGIPPQVSGVPETFVDTPILNGIAYPVLNVTPQAYRFRILNASNDRYWNLQLYVASTIVSGFTGLPSGSGYTAPPAVTIAPAVGDTTGYGATAVATVDLNPFLADGVTPNPTYQQVTALTLTTVGSGYTLPPVVTIAPPTAGTQATAVATLYTALTEVGMVPADKLIPPPGGWPAWWTANDTSGMTPNILDGRQGGVPDPRTMGPTFIHIGSEGGISPSAFVMQNTPIGYEQNKRSVTVLNTYDHTLFLGPAERADVIVDFSQFAGKTLIVYNDAPAPLPAGDPRNDYYTADPDNTSQGGAPSTQAGFGPNTRTVMQINVAATPVVPLAAGLDAAVAAAFTSTQYVPIVPPNTFAKISDTSMITNFNLNCAPGSTCTPTNTTLQMQPKTIQELFDPLGRMNSTLGVEVPFTTATIQTTIPYGFLDPVTEVIADGETQLWKITHNGVDTHAIHFHLFNVQVVNRVGWDGAIKPPWPEELGWKETVKMNPLEDIVVAMRVKVPTTLPFQQPNNSRLFEPNIPAGATTIDMNGTIVSPFTNVDPNGNPVTVSNAIANFGHEYTWHCHLLGHEENDMMRPVSVAVPPLPPGGLTTVVSKGNLVLTWVDNSPDETGYMVQKKTGTNPWTTIATLPAGTLTYTDTTWKSNQGAQYQIIAVNTVGSGVLGYPMVTAYSTPSGGVLAAAPLGATTITSVTQALAAGSPVVVKWTYSAKDQANFTIERSTSSTFKGAVAFTVGGTVFTFNDTTVVTGLKKNTTYYYRVTPTNSFGSGAPSATASLLVHP